jgi:hypothetical protein
MARKYANAYYLWTWHERVIEGQTVLSCTKDHDEGQRASFFILFLDVYFDVYGFT